MLIFDFYKDECAKAQRLDIDINPQTRKRNAPNKLNDVPDESKNSNEMVIIRK